VAETLRVRVKDVTFTAGSDRMEVECFARTSWNFRFPTGIGSAPFLILKPR